MFPNYQLQNTSGGPEPEPIQRSIILSTITGGDLLYIQNQLVNLVATSIRCIIHIQALL